MSIPRAVSPSQKTPGVYVSVNLLAGPASPGVGELLIALLSPRSLLGDLSPNTEVRLLSGLDGARTAFGPGAPGHQAAREIYARVPGAQIYAVAPSGAAGSATLSLLFSGTPATNNAVLYDIHGEEFEISWLAGETATEHVAKANAAVSERTDDLAVGSTGPTGLMQFYSKVGGNNGEDVKIKAALKVPSTGGEGVTGAASHTALSGTTVDPDYTTAYSLLAAKEYHYILPCLSNQDAVNVATTNNVKRLKTHISTYNEGLGAKLQQFVVGLVGTISESVASALSSNSASNVGYGQFILEMNGRDLPAEVAGAEVGGRLAAISDDPAANRIGELLETLAGAYDKAGDAPTLAESETALGGGVSLVSYTAQGIPYLMRAVTTHSQYDSGGADSRLLDVQNVDATYIITRDVAAALPLEFPHAKVTKDTVEGEEPPPEGVTEERDIRAFTGSRLRIWVRRGVATKASIDKAIDEGLLVVQVDDEDPTQVNIAMPFSIVPPLAKFGLVSNRVPL